MTESDNLNTQTDDLSIFAHRTLKLGGATAYTRLVVESPGNDDVKAVLDIANPSELLTVPVRNTEDAQAMLAGLWLWHDFLPESHAISQSLSSPTGSFWHAIMHRREGDFSNSCYWYARCSAHTILPALAAQAARILNPLPADKTLLRLIGSGWSPDGFVHLVKTLHEDPSDPRRAVAITLQQLEWRLLFEHCVRSASGK